MSAVWSSQTVPGSDDAAGQATQQIFAALIVLAAVFFNLVLCFVNTELFGISVSVVIGAEISLVAMALGLTWYRGYACYTILLLLAAYLFAVMFIRSDFDPKIVRDFLIPVVFFFLGLYLGSTVSADRLVTLLIFAALGVALFEWLALSTYLHYFDVIHYYLARGTEQNLAADTAAGLYIRGDSTAGLFINGTRFEARTLLPALGPHRVSGVFMEPVSVGNFCGIAFAWVLLRDRSHIWTLIIKTVAIAIMLVLSDARFGCFLCICTLIIYFAAPFIGRPALFLAPFVVILTLVAYAGAHVNELQDNTAAGRFLSAGNSLLALGPWQWLGLRASEFFVSGYAGDSGYGYALVKVGLVGLATIWALFVYAPDVDDDAWFFKCFIAFYVVSLLTISASLFSIKTAALVWYLYGTLNNPQQLIWMNALSVGKTAEGA